MASPDDASAQGWRKLPDELRLQIVRLALPSGKTYYGQYFNKGLCLPLVSHWSKQLFQTPDSRTPGHVENLEVYSKSLLPLLANPDTARFVQEAFYSQNIFDLCNMIKASLPPQSVLHFVRHVKLHQNYFGGWENIVNKVASGTTDLSNLHLVEIELDFWDESRSFLEVVPGLSFLTRALRVSYAHYRISISDAEPLDPLEEQLLAKFSIAWDGKQVHERWERSAHELGLSQGHILHYELWPERYSTRDYQRWTKRSGGSRLRDCTVARSWRLLQEMD
jgi:hypothetical protein